MTTVPVSVPVLRWAAHRARLHHDVLVTRFNKWLLWLNGDAQPTLKHLENFARPGKLFMTPYKKFCVEQVRLMLGTHT